MRISDNVPEKNTSDPGRRVLLGGLLGAFADPVLRILGGHPLVSELHAETRIQQSPQLLDFSSVLDKKPDPRFSHIFGKQNMEVSADALKIFHRKGTYGPQSGAGFIYELDHSLQSAVLTYDVMFKGYEANGGIDYGRGGKLPGFSGGDAPRGGADSNNGFSTRLMWTKNGGIDIYLYIPGKKEAYGLHVSGNRNFRFEPDVYYEIKQELKLNTPGKKDGSIVIYIDGKEVVRSSHLLFREMHEGNIDINSIMFSNFLGGHDPSWVSNTDFYTYLKNFKTTPLD